jgi:ATP-dependent helicase HrpB
VAQRRDARSPRLRLATGAGAIVAPESGVVGGEFLVAIDVQAKGLEARVRLASIVERDWLAPTASEIVHRYDRATGTVKAFEIDRYDALVLAERPVTADPDLAADLLADAWAERGPQLEDEALLRRLRFAGRSVELPQIVREAARRARSIDEVQLARALPADVVRALDRDAPETIVVPSGRRVTLEYGDDFSVSASVKLQELFGLAETPRVGARAEPVRFALLAPNGRPVQTTRDLRSFWERTYPEVRKELRGRYPKHPWPEDPWSAPPTARAKPRR